MTTSCSPTWLVNLESIIFVFCLGIMCLCRYRRMI
ncbi:UNVERIFIED_CONTAM: hypothetical protein GTU68_004789 [Idotea baltica]|nr:hypothetical protein [Idotea baltica]